MSQPYLFPYFYNTLENPYTKETQKVSKWCVSSIDESDGKAFAWAGTGDAMGFGSRTDCQIACDSLTKAGYASPEAMVALDETEFRRIACENLRW